MSEDLNYKEDIKIDPEALDIECLNQPRLYIQYAEMAAKQRRVVNRAEEKVKTIRSELINEANKRPGKYLDTPKAKDSLIEAYYRTHKDYKEAKEALHDQELELALLEVASNSINYHRKTSLEGLMSLQGQGYFAAPKEPRDLPAEYRKSEALEKNVVGKMKWTKAK